MNCTVLSTSVGCCIDYVICITSTFILDRQFTNNQVLFKEMLTDITSVGTVNPKCDIK